MHKQLTEASTLLNDVTDINTHRTSRSSLFREGKSKAYPINLEVKQDMGSHDYNLDYPRLATVLIFNQENFKDSRSNPKREGTEKDVERLKIVLGKICPKSTILEYKDLNYDGMIAVIDDLAKGIIGDLRNSASLMVFILTHGHNDYDIAFQDKEYNLHQFTEHFLPDKMQDLVAKPKMFFVQACRGSALDPGVLILPPNPGEIDETDSIIGIGPITYPSHADFLIGLSSHRSM